MKLVPTWSRSLGAVLVLALAATTALAFIERPTPLKDVLADSTFIFAAKVEKVDPTRPGAVLTVTEDYKGKAPYRRLAVNLTGDKEKHTPQLLKRIAADVPLVVFVLEEPNQHMALAYTNGTWFQLIGTKDGNDLRWAFTHCEIYLRRTFKGTTAELQKVVADVLAGKAKAPAVDLKEKPGMGPEIDAAPTKTGSLQGGALFGVIVLPFAMPIAALLQLLFPGLLRDQWRNYKVAVYVLLTQSTLVFVHWAVGRWLVSDAAAVWWLQPLALWVGLVAVAAVGAVVATVRRLRSPDLVSPAPTPVEYWALGALVVGGLAWAGWQKWSGEPPFTDVLGVVLFASVLALGHVVYRRIRYAGAAPRRLWWSTELVMVWGLVFVGVGLGLYMFQPEAVGQNAGPITTDWATFRGGPQRLGTARADDPGPTNPAVLWTFKAEETKGRVTIHATPVVVDGFVYFGALYEVLAQGRGHLYCVNAATGERVWKFPTEGAIKPVFSSPAVVGGQLFVGEGYHQDQKCRLLCLDARTAALKWARPTESHVESCPAVVGGRVYFGAGDEGLICLDLAATGADGGPKTAWQLKELHIDAAPLVAGDKVYAGSVKGDIYADLAAVAVDAKTGKEAWRVPAPLPVTGSPALANGKVFFGLGNGKMTTDAEQPRGAFWCLDAATGKRLWQYDVANTVLGTPVADERHVWFGARDGQLHCLKQEEGSPVWKRDLGSPIAAPLVLAGGKVYGLATDGTVFCCRADNGQVLWKLDDLKDVANGEAVAGPMLVGGRLYVAAGNQVVCIGDR